MRIELFAWIMENILLWRSPVSYTHLDVYKRQGLTGKKETYTGYYMKKDKTLEKMEHLIITDESGREIGDQEEMNEETIYELRVAAESLEKMNSAEKEGSVTVSMILSEK